MIEACCLERRGRPGAARGHAICCFEGVDFDFNKVLIRNFGTKMGHRDQAKDQDNSSVIEKAADKYSERGCKDNNPVIEKAAKQYSERGCEGDDEKTEESQSEHMSTGSDQRVSMAPHTLSRSSPAWDGQAS